MQGSLPGGRPHGSAGRSGACTWGRTRRHLGQWDIKAWRKPGKKNPGQESPRPGPPRAKCSHRPERGPEMPESKQQTHEGARTQRSSQTWVDGQRWNGQQDGQISGGWMDKKWQTHTLEWRVRGANGGSLSPRGKQWIVPGHSERGWEPQRSGSQACTAPGKRLAGKARGQG